MWKGGFYGCKAMSRSATRVPGQEHCAKAVDNQRSLVAFWSQKIERGEKSISLDREM